MPKELIPRIRTVEPPPGAPPEVTVTPGARPSSFYKKLAARNLIQSFGIYHRYGSRNVGFTLTRVTGYNHFFQLLP